MNKMKPVLSPDVEASVLDALSQYENRDKWRSWGLHNVREQGAAILLFGPPGCGKTMIAQWMAWKIRKGFKELGMVESDGSPGSSEKYIVSQFEDARKRHNMTIFLDECDALLVSRTGDVESSWQISTTETLMKEIARYPGLVICATNLPEKLDTALEQRFLALVEVKRPTEEMRNRIWRMKWPDSFPLQLRESELAILAKYDLNGRQIENVMMNVGSRAIRKHIKPNLHMFKEFAKLEESKHIQTK